MSRNVGTSRFCSEERASFITMKLKIVESKSIAFSVHFHARIEPAVNFECCQSRRTKREEVTLTAKGGTPLPARDFPKATFAESKRSRITLELLSRKAERASLRPRANRADIIFVSAGSWFVAVLATKERKKWIVGKSSKMQFCFLPFLEGRSQPARVPIARPEDRKALELYNRRRELNNTFRFCRKACSICAPRPPPNLRRRVTAALSAVRLILGRGQQISSI